MNFKRTKNKIRRMKVISVDFSEQVFLCKDGTPTKNSAYDTKLYYYCDKIGIKHFSMHTLRHTFATRCIEAGMKPKTLQMILGHSNIGITMNLYVHVTDDEKAKERALKKCLKLFKIGVENIYRKEESPKIKEFLNGI